MSSYLKIIIIVGFSLFTMFFGAGNIVFPLKLGANIEHSPLITLLSFLVTSVGIPFVGVFAIILYKGSYSELFNEGGKYLGQILALIVIMVLGIFIVSPRSSALVFQTNSHYLPKSNFVQYLFYFVYYFLIYFATIKKDKILEFLGIFLGPLKIVSLIAFMIVALVSGNAISTDFEMSFDYVKSALIYGYNTVDLPAGLFFTAFVYTNMLKLTKKKNLNSNKNIVTISLLSCILGGVLMCFIYGGFIFASYNNANHLKGIPEDLITITLAKAVLGKYAIAGISFVVSLACFATSVALTAVTVEYFKSNFLKRTSYKKILFVVIAINFFMSNLGFVKIMRLVEPVFAVLYPALIVLCLMALIYKLTGKKFIQVPVYLTIASAFILNFII